MRLIERLWAGDSASHRAARGALIPLEAIYRSIVAVRSEMYGRNILSVRRAPIGVVSVGNITVGGTGKTPVAAWIAERLAGMGRLPAIVLRGYGDDEPLVHARLNPGVPVIVDKNRTRGISRAFEGGADAAILDDAFQHRSAERNLDIVLISADDWTSVQRVLPAGPYREPPSALRRASMVLITSKVATPGQIALVRSWIKSIDRALPVGVVRLVQTHIIRENTAEHRTLDDLAGKRVLAIAAVGNPRAFFSQIESHGASVVPLAFPDHHPYSAEDIRRAVALSGGMDYVLCTLKDMVKLGPVWPATAPPLWYVSLSVEVESGAPELDGMLRRLPRRAG
jgi:tetraacyldisaccharide 4'-kinase